MIWFFNVLTNYSLLIIINWLELVYIQQMSKWNASLFGNEYVLYTKVKKVNMLATM